MIRHQIALALLSGLFCQSALAQVDESPLAIEPVLTFEKLKWSGWEADRDGVPTPLRPILLTHAGDGSGRIFVPQQQGIIHVFSPDSTETKVFLGATLKQVNAFFADEPSLFVGLRFVLADADGDGIEEMIVVANVGGGPRKIVVNPLTGHQVSNSFFDDPSSRTGYSIGG